MGVIRNQLNQASLDEEWLYLSSDGEESTQNVNVNHFAANNCRRRNQRPKNKSVTMPEPTFSAKGVKGKSHKKFRRYTNANLAMTELGSLACESELEAVTINDFITQTTSPFALLMQNLDQTIDLNTFLDCTEDEQRDLFSQDIKLEHCSFLDEPDIECPEKDSRQCFFRIDPKIRKQLVKKHIPIGILSSIETKIVQFFKDNPESLYKANFQSSYQRFLLHACCQYLNLNCQSVDHDGYRLSLVKNKHKNFSQPFKLLSEYLEVIL